MSVPEARAILSLNNTKDVGLDPLKIQAQFDKYFEANKVEKGGSFYLQSKIYRAKEALDLHIKEEEEARNAPPPTNEEEGGKNKE